jgi:hypothetical protein
VQIIMLSQAYNTRKVAFRKEHDLEKELVVTDFIKKIHHPIII